MTRLHHDDATVLESVDTLVGCVLDQRYRLDFRIAAGGFGAVYHATQIATGREVAIKVLHRQLQGEVSMVERFRREAAAITSLSDPHTVTAYDFGEAPDGTLYIVMELLSGESLYQRYYAQGALPWQQVVAIARGVCSSLSEAHRLGIVHRDLKPANIHLERRGNDVDYVKVLDFGIAKIRSQPEAPGGELTHVGQMIGTYDYMAPEQLVGGTCTPKSDIFTLGVVMYEGIAGERPWGEVAGPAEMLSAIFGTIPVRLAMRAQVPAALDRIVMRCLEREPDARFADASALLAELAEIEDDVDDTTQLRRATPSFLSHTTLPGIAPPPTPRRLAAGTTAAGVYDQPPAPPMPAPPPAPILPSPAQPVAAQPAPVLATMSSTPQLPTAPQRRVGALLLLLLALVLAGASAAAIGYWL